MLVSDWSECLSDQFTELHSSSAHKYLCKCSTKRRGRAGWRCGGVDLRVQQFSPWRRPAAEQQSSAQCPRPSASKSSIRRFVITEKAPTRAFSWLKAATTAFTFKTLLRHYAKRALTPRSLNVKLGPRRKGHKGRAAIRHYANQPARPFYFCVADPISR